MVVVVFTELFTNLGIAPAIIQLKGLSKYQMKVANTITYSLGFTLGLIFFILAEPFSIFFEEPKAYQVFQVFSLSFPLKSISSMSIAVLSKELKFDIIVKIGLLSFVSGNVILSIFLAFLGYGYWSLVIGVLFGMLVGTIGFLIIVPPRFTMKYKKDEIFQLINFGGGHTLGAIFNYVSENSDNFISGKILGTTSLGLYSKGFQLYSIPSTIIGSIYDKVFFPILAGEQDNERKIHLFYLATIQVSLLLFFPLTVFLICNADTLVYLVLGEQWTDVIILFQILSISIAFRMGNKVCRVMLKSLGLVYQNAQIQFISSIIMIGACFIGALKAGNIGLTIGVICSNLITFVLLELKLKNKLRYLRLTLISKFFIVFLMTAICQYAISKSLQDFIHHSLWFILSSGLLTLLVFWINLRFLLEENNFQIFISRLIGINRMKFLNRVMLKSED